MPICAFSSRPICATHAGAVANGAISAGDACVAPTRLGQVCRCLLSPLSSLLSRPPTAAVWIAGIWAVGAVATTACAQSMSGVAHRFRDVVLSPDGKYLAWIGAPGSGGASPRGGALVIMDRARGIASASAIDVSGAEPGTLRDLSWARDSHTLVFLGSTSDDATGLYVTAPVGAPRLVAAIPGSVRNPQLSPDGSQIAVLYASPAEEANGPTEATPRDTGLIDNFLDRQHLALVDAQTGALHVISPHDLYVFETQWAPNGHELVATAADGSGNNNWYVARIVAISLDGHVREVARPPLQMAEPQWSPDGAQIAYVGGLMSDEGVIGGDLYVVPATGGEPRDITPGLPVSVATFQWTGSRAILMTAWAHGGSEIASVNLSTGAVSPLWSTDDALSASGFLPEVTTTRDGGIVAMDRESLTHPPELWMGAPNQPTQLTHVNDGVSPAWGAAVHVTWHSDGMPIEGILLAPKQVVTGQRYPMIVSIHGGPAFAWRPFWTSTASQEAIFSQAGYYVFMPDPRGSYGAGEAFTRANVKDFGYGDLRDILSGIDTVVSRFPVDSQRLGITGGSYGGYMTMWAVTQTKRFRAAVSLAGLSNWLSYAGENGINRWMLAYFGGATVYDDPAVYARSAPITFIDHARTPTLIVAGERDAECPAPQSFEFWRGLQHAGAPAELIVYANEGHGIRDPVHQADLRKRMLAWFAKYLGGQEIGAGTAARRP
jgi:dipeptidyl aminopeptidase/acylaminoacyl peptidase